MKIIQMIDKAKGIQIEKRKLSFKIEKKRKTLVREKEDREFTHRETEYETAGEACIIA